MNIDREVDDMRRNIITAHEEYEKLYKSGKGIIYQSDIMQILEIVNNKKYEAICYAIEVGVVIGYRIAKRENKRNKCNHR